MSRIYECKQTEGRPFQAGEIWLAMARSVKIIFFFFFLKQFGIKRHCWDTCLPNKIPTILCHRLGEPLSNTDWAGARLDWLQILETSLRRLWGDGRKNCQVPGQGGVVVRGSWTHLLQRTYWMYSYLWDNFLHTKNLKTVWATPARRTNQRSSTGQRSATPSHFKAVNLPSPSRR